MYCPQCGTPNEESAAFCKSCGAGLTKYQEQTSASADETAAAGVATDAATADTTGATAQTSGAPITPPPYQPQYQQPAGAYPPAGYQPGAYQPGYNRGPLPNIPSYLGWAIATLILCFWPTGIVAVVYATKVGNLLSIGDVAGAQQASRNAKMWCWITFGIGVAIAVIAIIAVVAVLATAVGTLQMNY